MNAGEIPPQFPTPMLPSDETSVRTRQWATFVHLAALLGFFAPFLGIIGTLAIWLIKREELPGIDAHGKEAINFQITVLIAGCVSFLLCFVLIGFPMLLAVYLASIILPIVAAVKASEGGFYRHPVTLRLVI